MTLINEIFRIASITLLLFTCLVMLRYFRQGMHVWVGIGFTLSIVFYLIVETKLVRESCVLHYIVITGAITTPVLFWLLAKAIFDDHFKPSPSIVLWFVLQIGLHFNLYLNGKLSSTNPVVEVFCILAQIISIVFVLAGLYAALKTRQGDLIESRVRFRNIFIVITAALIGVTLIVEATSVTHQAGIILQTLQRASILGLSIYFLLGNFNIQPGFFFREIPKPKPVNSQDPILENKLMTLLDEQKVYRREGLTIKELADIMEAQEYKLRRLINGQLGFKNFNDFLNKYRVTEASEILSDSSQNQKTILEIAYSLGYQSIGPFNKAFKEQKNTTPTAFRKMQNP
ncbi:MAG: helix-turn-helix transcriptional regulator [Bacteroidetes bacterium]|nr:helix-turn-helix transcriptional regulator [Bacteroidota bacterium]